MASQYASPFDDLLNTGRRQLDELAGKSSRHDDASTSSAGATSGASAAKRGAPRTEPEAHSGAVIEGTAAGIAFKLRIK